MGLEEVFVFRVGDRVRVRGGLPRPRGRDARPGGRDAWEVKGCKGVKLVWRS